MIGIAFLRTMAVKTTNLFVLLFLLSTTSASLGETALNCKEAFDKIEKPAKNDTLNYLECIERRVVANQVPVGTIAAFDLDKCPNGWSSYREAEDRFILGAGSNNTLERGGSSVYKLELEHMPSHIHEIREHRHELEFSNFGSVGKGGRPAMSGSNEQKTGDVFTELTSMRTMSAGEGQEFELMPPFLTLKFCQKSAN